ncbi:proline--tRNA ligase, partial [Buchnera aphidicola]|nr:proline--tRNA ligase [Buchnera aphidicola]
YQSYCNIFNKIKINFHVVQADSGSMGGHISHEFQAVSENGEDEIVLSKNLLNAENINLARSIEQINFFKNKTAVPITKQKNTAL